MSDPVLDLLHGIDTKVDALADGQDRNTEAWKDNTKSLQEHMRRTEILELRMDPIEKLYIMAQGAVKGVVVLGGLAAIVKGCMELVKLGVSAGILS
jgi:hypothetical protein